MDRSLSSNRHAIILVGLGVLVLLACVVFMTYDAKGSWAFVLQFRGRKLAGMILVAAAIAISTILFQTITNNRILTPAIMGFDALYRLIQTLLVFFLSGIQLRALDEYTLFFAQAGIMVVLSSVLFRWLFSGAVLQNHKIIGIDDALQKIG